MKTHSLLKSSLLSFFNASFSRVFPVLIAGVSIASTHSPAKALINGSFEDPVVPSSTYALFGTGSTAITGWTVVGTGVAVLSGPHFETGIVFNSQDGNQWIDLTGVRNNAVDSGVNQIITTIIGQSYNVDFYVGSARNQDIFPSTVDLSIDGGTRQSFFNPAATNILDWKLFTTSFTATRSKTSLTFFNGNKSLNHFSGLENVTVSAAPVLAVPSPLPFLGIGSAFLWSRRIRKRIKGQL